MRLLSIEAALRMGQFLTDRADARDEPVDWWCKGQPGAVLSDLFVELTHCVPLDKTVCVVPAWQNLWTDRFNAYGDCAAGDLRFRPKPGQKETT